MTRTGFTSPDSRSRGMQYAVLAAMFVLAQLLITFHHVSDAHAAGAADDGIVVECDICIVASGVFDTPEPTPVFDVLPSGQTSFSLIVRDLPASPTARPGGPRAPPHPNT